MNEPYLHTNITEQKSFICVQHWTILDKHIMIKYIVGLLLFYAIATVLQLYPRIDMMYEMRRINTDPTLLPTQGIFNLRHHISMVLEELPFDDVVSYTQQ